MTRSQPENLKARLTAILGGLLQNITDDLGEITVQIKADNLLETAQRLRDEPSLCFEQLIDLCGVDYSAYSQGGADEARRSPRFAVIVHLLSIRHNGRVRIKICVPDDAMPVLPSLIDIWNSANWYEREAFDLFGIVFDGHPDLRRILTDYGFIGHPFRKDFPISGTVEMRYDPEQQRVIYQPVTIEPREITPRVIREEHYGGLSHQKNDDAN